MRHLIIAMLLIAPAFAQIPWIILYGKKQASGKATIPVTPSYSNSYGTGDLGSLGVTATTSLVLGGGSASLLIDGAATGDTYFGSNPDVAGKYIRYPWRGQGADD